MVPTLHREDRSDAGAFAPIERHRLVERLAASPDYPVVLLIAPAGYGKSVALRQYLGMLNEPTVRFTLRAEHATLLGFLRGLTEALGENAPHVIRALAGAYERNTASAKRGTDLADWLHAHLESFSGVIAIDDLHLGDGDPEVARFLTALIERTKGRIRWVLASRSTTGLPVGTWLAYRDADLPIDEDDLRFTLDEAREAALGLGLVVLDEELEDLLALTEGWPAAMSFALRTSTRSSDLRNVSAITREMIYRLLAEQVYATLDAGERNLLEVAVALPVMDVNVLELAGFDQALTIIESLREHTAFIQEESPGIYHCHDLFHEFLRHQTALGGKRSQQIAYERAARALEASGDVEHAIAAFVAAALPGDVVRLLDRHGFDLLERARGDVIACALEALDEKTRHENATMLALQGTLQAIAGKFARAESLFRRALARAGNDRDLVATVSLRLASLMGNQGRDMHSVLDAVASDEAHRAVYRAEALSLIAARQAIAGDLSSSATTVTIVEGLLPHVDLDARRARILHHLGIVHRHIGNVQQAFERLTEANELASELHFYGVASRTYAVLSNLALHEEDDVTRQLYYAEFAADAATKAGDAFALQTALLQMLSARMRNGDVDQSIVIERRLAMLQTDGLGKRYIAAFQAVRLAWEGRFAEACGLLSACLKELPFGIDWATSAAQHALFLGLDGHRDGSIRQINDVLSLVPSIKVSGRFDLRSVAICQATCALADLANGRPTSAERILRRLSGDDSITRAVAATVKSMMRALRCNDPAEWAEATDTIERLMALGYCDVARLLVASAEKLRPRFETSECSFTLTASECDVLRLLANGLVPKEIAAETKRSVHTVRAHIANAIGKLGCHGRAEAIKSARQRRLI